MTSTIGIDDNSKSDDTKHSHSQPLCTPPAATTATATAAIPNGSPSLLPKRRFKRNDKLLHLLGTNKKLIIGMVGLPARGKTYIAKKLGRYLNWLGYKTEVFNIGAYRRKLVRPSEASIFFDPNNAHGVARRQECVEQALNDMCRFLRNGGQAAILDGGNASRSRRKFVLNFFETQLGPDLESDVMWVESVCTDEGIIAANFRETKLTSPEYVGVDPKTAAVDFRSRIAFYEREYQPLSVNSTQSYVKLINVGQQVIVNRVNGYLPGRIVAFLMNLRINKHPILLSRHGESEFNTRGLIGGDSELSPFGQTYAKALGEWVGAHAELTGGEPVATSTTTTATTATTILTTTTTTTTETSNGQSMTNTFVTTKTTEPLTVATTATRPIVITVDSHPSPNSSSSTSTPSSTISASNASSRASSVSPTPSPMASSSEAEASSVSPWQSPSAAPSNTTSTTNNNHSPLEVLSSSLSTPASTVNQALPPSPLLLSRRSSSGSDAPTVSILSRTGSEDKKSSKKKTPTMVVWVSTLVRTQQTAAYIPACCPVTKWRALVEIEVGTCNALTYEDVERKFPEEAAMRKKDKFRYRYPQGESYKDVIDRLEPVIFELERIKGPVLVIAHRAVLRCIYAYFLDLQPEQIPHLDVPLHTVIKLQPKAYGCDETRFVLAPVAATTDNKVEQALT